MNCDRVVFAGDYPPLPYGAPIVSFSQRWSGQQSLPTQIFPTYGLPLKELDLSHNSLRRLPDRLLSGVRGNITRLVLAVNLLGDNLNPIFLTTEFHNLPALEELDLSGNSSQGLEEGLLIGCDVLKGSVSLRDLQVHDLGRNMLSKFKSDVFLGIENLEKLDLWENFITDFPTVAMKSFTALRQLNLSSNMITVFPNLIELRVYGYPRVGYFDMQGTLQHLFALEKLDVEVKDTKIGADQLAFALHARLEELGIRGDRLKTISSGVIAVLNSPFMIVRFRNTSVSSLQPALLFPLPRSSQITIDMAGSQVTTLQPQLLVALDDRRADLSMFGLDTNPIRCDCNYATLLRRWLPNVGVEDVQCHSPDYLAGFLSVEIGDDELTCDTRKRTTLTSSPSSLTTTNSPRLVQRTSVEPDIIWSVAPSHERAKSPGEPKGAPVIASSSNDDNL
ncbi:unnamed protein product [Parnassius apollo]|uniref:(apollo) hypothetical protein n=1 Tax=Parnassius apollo TaxID=110799 RepID=A0A8S3WV22_PARAO|nr:unnamed protein product [Parnassius apollo]